MFYQRMSNIWTPFEVEIRSALYTSKYPYNKGQITQEEVKREIEIKQEQKTPEIKVKVKTIT